MERKKKRNKERSKTEKGQRKIVKDGFICLRITCKKSLNCGRMIWTLGLWTPRHLDFGCLDNRLTSNNHNLTTKD